MFGLRIYWSYILWSRHEKRTVSGATALRNLNNEEVFPSLGESIAKLKVQDTPSSIAGSKATSSNEARRKESFADQKVNTSSATANQDLSKIGVEETLREENAAKEADSIKPKEKRDNKVASSESKSAKFAKLAAMKKKKAMKQKAKPSSLNGQD